MSEPSPNRMTFSKTEDAVLTAFCYADIFSFPLKQEEIGTYMPFVRLSPQALEETVESLLTSHRLVREGIYLALPDRTHLPALRQGKEDALKRKWAKLKTHLPGLLAQTWIKGTLLTGSMAAGNASERDDVDLFLILDRRRMWLGYLVFRLLARRIREIEVCPNYVISDHARELPFPNLFTAIEWSMAIPLKSGPALMAMEQANSWCGDFIPNLRTLAEKGIPMAQNPSLASRVLSCLVFSPLGWALDRLECRRLKWRTGGRYQPSPHVYKPHPPTRQVVIFDELVARLNRYQLTAARVRHHIQEQKTLLAVEITHWGDIPERSTTERDNVGKMVPPAIKRPAPSALD